jgi:hypothetical protein
MTQHDMSLILLALGALTEIDGKSASLRTKNPANVLTWRVFILVAGVRFELTTFRL